MGDRFLTPCNPNIQEANKKEVHSQPSTVVLIEPLFLSLQWLQRQLTVRTFIDSLTFLIWCIESQVSSNLVRQYNKVERCQYFSCHTVRYKNGRTFHSLFCPVVIITQTILWEWSDLLRCTLLCVWSLNKLDIHRHRQTAKNSQPHFHWIMQRFLAQQLTRPSKN